MSKASSTSASAIVDVMLLRPIAHPPSAPGSSAGATQWLPSQVNPGAHSVLIPHVLPQVPSVLQTYGLHGVDRPSAPTEENLSGEHVARLDWHVPVLHAKSFAQCSAAEHDVRHPLSSQA
jgi:hypothetical protein